MRRILNKDEDNKMRIMEKEIFRLEIFEEEVAFFPDNPFKQKFDTYYFLPFNNIFWDEEESFNDLIDYLKEINENSFYTSAPNTDFPIIETLVIDSPNTYFWGISSRFEDLKSTPDFGNGMHIFGHEILTYSKNRTWAMVHDRDHDLIIIGINDTVKNKFITNFSEARDLKSFLSNLQDYFILDSSENFLERIKMSFN